jgi:hypothetical protein
MSVAPTVKDSVWVGRVRGYVRGHRAGIVMISALAAPLGVAALIVPFRASFASPAAALVLVAVVAAVAILGNRVAGSTAALGASIWFDFFLTKPYERLTISHRADIETAVSLLVVGIIVTELAARGRHHRNVASEEARYLTLLHETAGLVAAGTPAATVIERVRLVLVTLLDLRDCRYESSPSGRRRATIQSDGEVVYGAILWGASTMGLPGREVDLPIEYGGRSMGRFALIPSPGEPVSLERRIVAVALAAQAGSALAARASHTG